MWWPIGMMLALCHIMHMDGGPHNLMAAEGIWTTRRRGITWTGPYAA